MSRTRQFSTIAKSFEDLCLNRYSVHKFDSSRSIDPLTIKKIVQLTQSSPSSFNLQPYKIILVQDQNVKSSISSAMLGGNRDKVLDASVTTVFLSYRDPSRLTSKLMKIEHDAGKSKEYVNSLPSKIDFLLSTRGFLSSSLKRIGGHLLSPLRPMPRFNSDSTSWSEKNTALAAQTYMLAAASMGIQTAPMEGFDERRLCSELQIPIDEYSVPIVVATGYATDESNSARRNPRYKMEDICYEDSFGNPLKF